jgi:hypothetical protein
MAGYPDNNFPAFQAALDWCREHGVDALSPHEIAHPDGSMWADFLRRDIEVMVRDCRGLILLQGWPQSKGARLELATAVAMDWPVMYFTGRGLIDMNRGAA